MITFFNRFTPSENLIYTCRYQKNGHIFEAGAHLFLPAQSPSFLGPFQPLVYSFRGCRLFHLRGCLGTCGSTCNWKTALVGNTPPLPHFHLEQHLSAITKSVTQMPAIQLMVFVWWFGVFGVAWDSRATP